MKLLTIILIVTLSFSCSDKKSTKENTVIDKQRVKTVKETNPSNKNEVQKAITDTTGNKQTQEPEITVKNNTDNENTVVKKHHEVPADGTYTYDVAYAEWQGRSMGEKVKVIIKGNTIKIIAEGKSSMGVKNGELIDQGMLVKHNKTGDWLITDNPLDANLEAYGGCVGTPMVIDFKNKKYWTC